MVGLGDGACSVKREILPVYRPAALASAVPFAAQNPPAFQLLTGIAMLDWQAGGRGRPRRACWFGSRPQLGVDNALYARHRHVAGQAEGKGWGGDGRGCTAMRLVMGWWCGRGADLPAAEQNMPELDHRVAVLAGSGCQQT